MPLLSGVIAMQYAINEGLDDANKYLLLGWALGSNPMGLGVTLALANQEAEQLPPASPVVTGVPLSIATVSIPNAVLNGSYTATLVATGGNSPITWSVSSGTLPPGLALNSTTGAITGAPTTLGSFNFTIQAQDASGNKAPQPFSISVGPALSITTTSPLPGGTVNASYSASLAASGGTQPYSWSVSGGLPAGLTLNASSGTITGVPTVSGTFNFTVTVTDATNSVSSLQAALTLNPGLNIVTTLPDGSVGIRYPSQTLSTDGGTQPFTWAVINGALPAGLVLSPGGVISGTPTTAGKSEFTVKVTDSVQATSTEEFTLNIAAVTALKTARAKP